MFKYNLEGEEIEVFELKDWKGSFDEDFKKGDYVNADIAWDLINALPPHRFGFGYFQCGEPHSYRPDENGELRATYLTLNRVNDEPEIWKYLGNNFTGRM